MVQSTQIQPAVPLHDEYILVVKRSHLFSQEPAWQGIQQVDFGAYLELIQKHQEFLPRSLMESDPTYKQIIPYLIFCYQDTYFLMQRSAHATEQRLRNKTTLGIGGHIRQEDMLLSTSIMDWATREFHEEVSYDGTLDIEPLGIINDDSNPVGQVHLGFALLLKGSHNNIAIKDELASGTLLTLQECQTHLPTLESWSKLVLDLLLARHSA